MQRELSDDDAKRLLVLCEAGEPHCHGCSTDDNDLLRGYQVEGYSSSGDSIGWKMFRLDRMSGLVTTAATFHGPRPEYDPNDNSMATVYCSL
jgi:hypothetical protein